MNYTIEFDPRNGLLQCRMSGEVTDELMKAAYSAIREQAMRTHIRGGVLDVSDVTSFEVTPQFLRALAREVPALPDPNVPRVVIAPSDYMFGMARMFQTLGEDTRPLLHVVRTRREAYALLGVLEPKFEPVDATNPG